MSNIVGFMMIGIGVVEVSLFELGLFRVVGERLFFLLIAVLKVVFFLIEGLPISDKFLHSFIIIFY